MEWSPLDPLRRGALAWVMDPWNTATDAGGGNEPSRESQTDADAEQAPTAEQDRVPLGWSSGAGVPIVRGSVVCG